MMLFIFFISSLIITKVNCIADLHPINHTEITACTDDEVYNSIRHSCMPCPENTIAGDDKINCVCKSRYYHYETNSGGVSVVCKKCPSNSRRTIDGYSCLKCQNVDCKDPCKDGEATNHYSLDGKLKDAETCINCMGGTWPTESKQNCIACKGYILHPGSTTDCSCDGDYRMQLGYCVQKITTDDKLLINYDGVIIESKIFYDMLEQSVAYCKKPFENQTSCNRLANLCALTLYDMKSIPCKEYTSLMVKENLLKPDLFPEILYEHHSNENMQSIYNAEYQRIETNYLFRQSKADWNTNVLNIRLATYDEMGRFIGLINAFHDAIIQLCGGRHYGSIYAYLFGNNYRQKCHISYDWLKNHSPNTLFFDAYLETYETDKKYSKRKKRSSKKETRKLYPILVKIKNGVQNITQYTRRFFIIDKVGGKDRYGTFKRIRYAKKIKMNIELVRQTKNTSAFIYPIMMEIEYASFNSSRTYRLDETTEVMFEMEYKMNLNWFSIPLIIFLVIGSIIGISIGIFKSMNWKKMDGRELPDILVLIRFSVYSMGLMADAIFLILISVAFWYLIFFKRQDVAYVMLPTPSQMSLFKITLIICLICKTMEIIQLLFSQITIDIFFLDWERLNLVSSCSDAGDRNIRSDPHDMKNHVSAWRTYFIVHEWINLQTKRKVNLPIHLFILLFVLIICDIQKYSTSDPTLQSNELLASAPYHSLLRLAVGLTIFVILGIVLWMIQRFIVELFIENRLARFVDLCMLTNISLLIFSQRRMGYYIHGRNAGPTADGNIEDIALTIQQESESKRNLKGLFPKKSNQQSFIVVLTEHFRTTYESFLNKANDSHLFREDIGHIRATSTSFRNRIRTYYRLNSFLLRFINEGARLTKLKSKKATLIYSGPHYRSWIENLLNVQFRDACRCSMFYCDDERHFDNVIWYGNERCLFIWNAIIFALTDYFAHSYLIAAFVCWLLNYILNLIRIYLAIFNLQRTTLVDPRFVF
ncbi:hypothetical protein SNEBB_010225 [Seison nebaliae]|nr:hypothetical protein SNEBB_010225 [Seison nebaliae]